MINDVIALLRNQLINNTGITSLVPVSNIHPENQFDVNNPALPAISIDHIAGFTPPHGIAKDLSIQIITWSKTSEDEARSIYNLVEKIINLKKFRDSNVNISLCREVSTSSNNYSNELNSYYFISRYKVIAN